MACLRLRWSMFLIKHEMGMGMGTGMGTGMGMQKATANNSSRQADINNCP